MNIRDHVFPQETWAEIMTHCSQEELVKLSRVSPLLRTEARKLLLRKVVSENWSLTDREPIGVIHRPWAFYEFLSRSQVDWRRMIRIVKLNWQSEYMDKDGNDAPFGRQKPIQEHLTFKTAILLSESRHLNEFHFNTKSLAITTAILKHNTPPLTSIDFSLPHRYTWQDIYSVFTLPTLVTLVIRNLLSPDRPAFRFPPPVPDDLVAAHATSNIRALSLLDCGPLTQSICPVFQWPRNLQRLIYSPARSKCEPYWRTILRRNGDISDAVDLAVKVLAPLQASLQELEFDLGLDRYWILPFRTGTLFYPFTKLTALTVPIELVMHSRGLSRSRSVLPCYTNLPHGLQDLELRFTVFAPWHSRVEDTCLISDPAHQLFEELSLLAIQKDTQFPGLRQLTLTGDGERPVLIKCCHAEVALKELEDNGVRVVERDWCHG